MSTQRTQTEYQFGEFTINTRERTLFSAGERIELNGRYFDALVLLVEHAGQLIAKETFMAKVWHGVAVTDEALTQCIRSLRRALGDNARAPCYIETVPKHGYRFIAEVKPRHAVQRSSAWMVDGGLATLGAGAAGLSGGAVLGGIAAVGSELLSVMPVIAVLSLFVALLGGAAVSFAALLGAQIRPSLWAYIVGGAAGGAVMGGLFNWAIIETFRVLLGSAPQGITGSIEGLIIGAVVGLQLGLIYTRQPSLRTYILCALTTSFGAAMLITAMSGVLMAGSLSLLGETFPASAVSLMVLGQWLNQFGQSGLMHIVFVMIELLLFSLGIGLTLRVYSRIDRSLS